jgi:hypothetical protein
MIPRLLAILLCIGILLSLPGCKSADVEWQKATVTAVKPGETIHLRVLHAVNPRFSRMSVEQLRIMLETTRKTVKQNFGVDVEFSGIDETGMDQLFARLPAPIRKSASLSIYDFKSGNGDRRKLADGIYATLTQRHTRLEDALAFARPYLPADARPADLHEFCELLSQVMLDRLEYWRKLKAADGAPVLDASPYNEWVYWDALGYSDLPYDVVISNQLIASAEYVDVDVHSAIRGGITVGTTSYSRNNPYGAYAFWSTFPFTDDSANTKLLRGGEVYSPVEAAELSGEYLAHEIGHVLFQFGHPFTRKACVMNPVSMLRFREWSQQIDAAACTIGSRPEMTPGAIPVYFNTRWQKMSQGQ